MDERVMQFRVGVVVLVSLLILGALIGTVTGVSDWFDLFAAKYTVYVRFPQAGGVARDTPVHVSGIRIGRVTDVRLSENAVLVTLAIEDKYKLRHNQRCVITGRGLLGENMLNFISGAPHPTKGAAEIQDGETIDGLPATDPAQILASLQVGVDRVVDSVSVAGDEITGLARDVRGLIGKNEEQLARVLRRSEDTLEKVGRASENLAALLDDPQMRANLKQTMAEMPKLLAEAREAAANARDAMSGLKQTLASAERNLEHIEKFTEPLGRRGESLIARADDTMLKIGRSADRLDELMNNMVSFSRALNNRDSSLGRLINDDELYHNLVSATDDLQRLTLEARPILRDARLFADKIARHPELLGAGGALRGSSGAKPVQRSYQNLWEEP